MVDTDPQGHATLGLQPDAVQLSKTMYDVFVQHGNGRETRLRDITRPVHARLQDPLKADVEPAPYGGHNSVFVLDASRSE